MTSSPAKSDARGATADRTGPQERTRSFWNARHRNEGSDESREEIYALASPRFVEAHHGHLFKVSDPSHGEDWLGWVRQELEDRLPFERLLFLGCGDASALLDLHSRGFARRLVGVDLSDAVIERGRVRVEGSEARDAIRLLVGDLDEHTWEPNSFDAVFCVMSLHHAMDVPPVVRRIHDLLPPGGVFVANEYVGPDRWQFTTAQLACIRAVMALLPKRLRRRPDGSLKPVLGRPPLEWMIQNDPSEAADSESIDGALRSLFEDLRSVHYGGGLALPVLDETMGSYRAASRFDRAAMGTIARLDRLLTHLRIVPNSNSLYIARKSSE